MFVPDLPHNWPDELILMLKSPFVISTTLKVKHWIGNEFKEFKEISQFTGFENLTFDVFIKARDLVSS